MDSSTLRRQPTLPLDFRSESPPRKILKAKRRLPKPSGAPDSLIHTPSISSLIKPSLSKRKSSLKHNVSKVPSLTKKASIIKETDDVATAAVTLDSGSHVGKTGVITEDDVAPDAEVTEVNGGSIFSSTGDAVVTSLRKSLSGSSTLGKRLSKKKSSIFPPLPLVPPGGLIEVVFSFDTTGSMSAALDEVKGRIKDIVQKLQSDVPGIRIAIFAHGDYCDKHTYIIKWIDFGASIPELHDFVNNCERTGGGDGPECYELVLRRATEVLSWTPGSKRSLVIIGDNIPHEPGYTYGEFTNDINWREECDKLKGMGVKVYGVACRTYSHMIDSFYRDIAARTGGLMIPLDKFDLLFDLMMAICYREGGEDLLEAYQEELKEKYGVTKLNKNLSGMFANLKESSVPTTHGLSSPLFLPPVARTSPFTSPFTPGIPTFLPPVTSTSIFTSPFATPLIDGTKAIPFSKLKKIGKVSKATKRVGKLTANKNVKEKTTKNVKNDDKGIPREKINDKKFKSTKPINRLQWSQWILAISLNGYGMRGGTRKVKWVQGYALKDIFQSDAGASGIFELALQPKGMKKKYVIAFVVSNGLPSSRDWMQTLIGRKYLKTKIAQAISQDASVFVRRGKFKKRNKKFMETVHNFLKKSNYAFGTSKRNSRDVNLKGLKLN